jgi:hypothetical protein
MKKITLKIVERKAGGEKLNYQTTILGLISQPDDRERGMQFKEMKAVEKAYDQIEAAELPEVGPIDVLLEDAEHALIVKKLENAKFVGYVPEICRMIEEIKDAPNSIVSADKAG